MITYLKVANLAIVEELSIEPGAGLNVLTGETGAGKSLLIDSLAFLSGARGTTALIRSGEERMTAEAVFHLPVAWAPRLRESGVEPEQTGDELELIVRREMSENGRSRVLLNGSVVTVRELSAVMDLLLEIHGQNESLDRVAGQPVREVLDQYGRLTELTGRVSGAYEEWRTVASELAELTGAQRDRELRLDLLNYQMTEISAARLEPGEEETLREERAILANAQEMIAATSGAFDLLSEAEESAIALVGRASQLLAPLSREIAEIRGAHDELEDVRIRLQETARTIAALAEEVRHDPSRLEEIEDRLALIERLRKKYGESIEAILNHLETISEEHERLADYETSIETLRSREEAAYEAYRLLADDLSTRRHEAAANFRIAIEHELKDLAMEGTTIEIRVFAAPSSGSRLSIAGQSVAFGPEGYDRVEIWIAANRGEELRPLQKVASGGELSRMQLAIASAMFKSSERGGAATLVFDEIDAGIGGRVADAVGSKLRELASVNQVICVTHLPQIAGLGSVHFHVWKEEIDDRTTARISRLDQESARVEEIARMLGGEKTSDSARAHAKELLARRDPDPVPRGRKRNPARAVS
ncbi:MAG: DNA repair protein RecN [Thermoanaerobaculia bacterium]